MMSAFLLLFVFFFPQADELEHTSTDVLTLEGGKGVDTLSESAMGNERADEEYFREVEREETAGSKSLAILEILSLDEGSVTDLEYTTRRGECFTILPEKNPPPPAISRQQGNAETKTSPSSAPAVRHQQGRGTPEP
ncbi:hypothetical protein Mapa_014687 [Marchantia paleacea]|nr:hypothetical protein Mapa_014687 [Marchantia paleacea]